LAAIGVGIGAVGVAAVAIAVTMASEGAAGGVVLPVAKVTVAAMFISAAGLWTQGYIQDSMPQGIICPSINEVRGGSKLPDKSVPGSVVWSPSGQSGRLFGEDGLPDRDWNEPHPDSKKPFEKEKQHIHRWEPRSPAASVPGKGSRGSAESPTQDDKRVFEKE
jgi:hypothetical protein